MRRLYYFTLSMFLSCSAHANEEYVDILSYNIRGLFWPQNPDDSRFKQIAEELKARRNKPDFVLFQEIFMPESRAVYTNAGYPYHVDGGTKNLRVFNSGLHIMSLHPVTQSKKRRLRYCFLEECFAAKGLQAAIVQKPSMPFPIVIMNTHMQAQSELPIYDYIRKRQISRIQKFVETGGYKEYVIFFGGDFNIRPHLRSYAFFKNIFHDFMDVGRFCLDNFTCQINLPPPSDTSDVWQATNDRQFFYTPPGSGIQIDPVRFERSFTAPHKDDKYLSDHWGLEVRYRLTWPSIANQDGGL